MMSQKSYVTKLPNVLNILDSVGKVRIIHLLAVNGETNITAILQFVKSSHGRITLLLRELVDEKVVQEKTFGRIRILSLNPHNEAANRLSKFFTSWAGGANDINLVPREKL